MTRKTIIIIITVIALVFIFYWLSLRNTNTYEELTKDCVPHTVSGNIICVPTDIPYTQSQ